MIVHFLPPLDEQMRVVLALHVGRGADDLMMGRQALYHLKTRWTSWSRTAMKKRAGVPI